MAVVCESKEEDDGIHPLDRDYTKPVPTARRRLIFTKSRGLNIGIAGFAVGGFVLLIGIVLSQLGEGNRSFEAMAATAHRLGMWSILLGGGCIIFAMQTRADKPRAKRKRGGDVMRFSIVANAGSSPFVLGDWQCALEEFDYLLVSQLRSDWLAPELEDIYLQVDGRVLAVLYWDRVQQGVVRMRVRRQDFRQVKQLCWRLLAFLDAKLVDDSTGVRN
ncbi:MAG: hypothetical protein CBD74_12800 [Saprospirales bacterium TMED214]|nr:MAG: hypothetical protein CBD74_12800 [Saprospirales bacterium TMED214]